MTPYAHYAAQLQPGDVPLSVVLFQQKPVKPATGRRVSFAMDRLEDFSKAAGFVEREQIRVEPKAPRFDRYRPFLSSTWKTTKEIADESGLHQVTVNKFLRSQPEHVEKKAVATEGGYSVNYWKLRDDNQTAKRAATRKG